MNSRSGRSPSSPVCFLRNSYSEVGLRRTVSEVSEWCFVAVAIKLSLHVARPFACARDPSRTRPSFDLAHRVLELLKYSNIYTHTFIRRFLHVKHPVFVRLLISFLCRLLELCRESMGVCGIGKRIMPFCPLNPAFDGIGAGCSAPFGYCA